MTGHSRGAGAAAAVDAAAGVAVGQVVARGEDGLMDVGEVDVAKAAPEAAVAKAPEVVTESSHFSVHFTRCAYCKINLRRTY